jgi:formylglycine-generating enzyme required for sulfatase activity
MAVLLREAPLSSDDLPSGVYHGMHTPRQLILGGALLATLLGLAASVPARPDEKKGGVAPKSYTETIPTTKVQFEMIGVPGGTFVMGSPADEKGRKADEGPAHPVELKPFWIAKHEVTWDEYDIFRRETGVDNPGANDDILKKTPDAITGPTPPYVDETYGHQRDLHPAICMTHHAAMNYCAWLSKKTGKAYRLPTEAEWEYACRAGSKTAYCFGDDPKQLGEYGWFAGNSEETTHKVASKKANAWGIHDMHGNVLEWCLDHYKADSYAAFPLDKATLQPVDLPTDRRYSHVARGGCWSDEAPALRSAARRGSDKTWMKDDPQKPKSIWWLTNFDIIGFRVVCAVEEQANLKGIRSKVTRDSQ